MQDNEHAWRWVPGYEHIYKVNDIGQVMSVSRVVKGKDGIDYLHHGKLLTPHDNGHGYFTVCLYRNGKGSTTYIHRIVASAFIPNVENKREVNHKDGNKANNTVDNLEWVTSSENELHAYHVINTMRPNRSLTEDEVVRIRSDTRTHREISEELGVDTSIISQVKRGKTYKTFPGKLDMRKPGNRRKLTADQVREIRSSDESIDVLAKRYGVSRSTVFEVRRKTRYKDVE